MNNISSPHYDGHDSFLRGKLQTSRTVRLIHVLKVLSKWDMVLKKTSCGFVENL